MTAVATHDSFGKDARIVELLRSMHQMEMYGESMFALMMEHGERLTLEQRCKLEACRLLEVGMADLLSRHLTLELGLPLAPTVVPATVGAAGHAAIHEPSWSSRMSALEGVSAEMIAACRELKSLYADRQPRLCNTLLAHCLMIRGFAHDEAEGEGDRSLRGVVTMLGAEDREALALFQA